MISEVNKIPVKNMQILYAGKILLDDNKQLSDYEENFGSG